MLDNSARHKDTHKNQCTKAHRLRFSPSKMAEIVACDFDMRHGGNLLAIQSSAPADR